MSGPRVLLIDNYDSFVGVLYQYFGELGAEPLILRNDAVTAADVRDFGATHLLFSPGPCTPREAGASVELIREFAGHLPILGICLGHQSLAAAFGGRIVSAKRLVHGKAGEIHHRGTGVLRGLPSPLRAALYHSLAVERAGLPEELKVTAWTDAGEIMGLRRRREGGPTAEGLQFHPESVLTDHGHAILTNFLEAGP